jgi:hypothetical protein
MKCQYCRRHKAIWRVGNDGFSARPGARVCDNFGCRSWGSGGYAVSLWPIKKK